MNILEREMISLLNELKENYNGNENIKAGIIKAIAFELLWLKSKKDTIHGRRSKMMPGSRG